MIWWNREFHYKCTYREDNNNGHFRPHWGQQKRRKKAHFDRAHLNRCGTIWPPPNEYVSVSLFGANLLELNGFDVNGREYNA